ncbi:MAG: ABC transporter permease [Chitinophagaceae bacterium]|nr:ABC transporter permease [Chitinophagaceae bacterium]
MYFSFAWRYFKAKKSTNAINIVAWVTTGVIAFSTLCQVLVLNVFNGFESLVKSLYANFYSDIKVVAPTGKTIFLTNDQLKEIASLPGVTGTSLNLEEKALLQNGDQQTVVYLKGVDSNYSKVSGLPTKMYRGSFDVGDTEHPLLVLGVGIESAMNISSDQNIYPLTVFLPKKTNFEGGNPLSSLSEGNAYLSGSFAIQQDFDNKYVITNIGFLRQQMNYADNEYTSLEIQLAPGQNADDFAKRLQQQMGDQYKVQTKYEQNTSLYQSMRVEKWFIYAVLTLILIIAAFNIIGALTMLVLEKKKDISVLLAMGADKSMIRKIFLSEGLLLAAGGAVAGIILALIISLLQMKFHFVKLYGTSFLIDYFPVKMVFTDFLLVTTTAFIIAFLASWFPAQKAASQSFDLKTS